jgi:hypothetical protein
VDAILMPLKSERYLCLALSAEANNLVKVLIRLTVHPIRRRRQEHLAPLLQDRSRLYLVHEAAFAFKGVTYRASHIVFYFLLLYAAVKWCSRAEYATSTQ